MVKKYFNNAFWIGILSFFGGISQDVFLPVLPLYLANVLNLDKSFIGISEGLVTSSSSIFKIVSGILTDKLKNRKPIVFIGYFLSLLGRILMAFTTVGGFVLFLRFLDGVGKGVKDSPKDALIADTSESKTRGKSFGIVRALDTLGSVAGPLLLFGLLFIWKNNPLKYQYIFLTTAIPLIFTLSIIGIFVHESPFVKREEKFSFNFSLPKGFYAFLAIFIIFSLGKFSDTFLILRAQNVGVGILSIPLVYALFNFVYAIFSVPLGSLSDKIGREKVIILGWLSYSLAFLGFAAANQVLHIWILFAFYGIYYATTEGVAKAYIADLVKSGQRGKAYGLFNMVSGLITLPSSFLAGMLWDKFNPSTPFYLGAAIALVAAILLFLYAKVSNST